MRISIYIKFDEDVLKEYTPNPLYEYAEMIEILRAHGFVHCKPTDIGFINDDATEEDAKKAIAEVLNTVPFLDLDGAITELEISEIGETVPFDFKDLK